MLENERREKFCQMYARGNNAASAYKRAGYHPKNDKSAAAAASRLLADVNILRRLDELTAAARKAAMERAETEEKNSIADIAEIRQRITGVLRGESPFETKTGDIIRAGELLAKLEGVMRERVEVTVSVEDYLRRLTDDGKGQSF